MTYKYIDGKLVDMRQMLSDTQLHIRKWDTTVYQKPINKIKPLWQKVEDTLLHARFAGEHARLSNTPIFHIPGRQISVMAKSAEFVPHTRVPWVDYEAVESVSTRSGERTAPARFAVIIWYRRHSLADLYDAIATLSMMTDATIIVARGFSGEFYRSDK